MAGLEEAGMLRITVRFGQASRSVMTAIALAQLGFSRGWRGQCLEWVATIDEAAAPGLFVDVSNVLATAHPVTSLDVEHSRDDAIVVEIADCRRMIFQQIRLPVQPS